jgi:hypothetical protein
MKTQPTRKTQHSEPIPTWGKWLIGTFVAVVLIAYLILSGAMALFFHAVGETLSGTIPAIGFLLMALLYFLPTLIASGTPRVAAIAVANLIFGWTIIGWFIVLIWGLAESGTKKDQSRH